MKRVDTSKEDVRYFKSPPGRLKYFNEISKPRRKADNYPRKNFNWIWAKCDQLVGRVNFVFTRLYRQIDLCPACGINRRLSCSFARRTIGKEGGHQIIIRKGFLTAHVFRSNNFSNLFDLCRLQSIYSPKNHMKKPPFHFLQCVLH